MEENALAKYIVDDLFEWFRDERNTRLETTMRRSYDAFRGRYESESLMKWKATEGKDWRSKVFVRLTKQKVVAGFNQVSAVALHGQKLRWDLKPTPVPESAPGIRLPEPEAKVRAGRMKAQIDDDFTQCNAQDVILGSILERTIYGWSWLWAPILRSYNRMVVDFGIPGEDGLYFSPEIMMEFGRHTLRQEKYHRPIIENPSIWSVFWDLETADHQKGQGIIIREMMSVGRFLDLAEKPGYEKGTIQEIAKQYGSKKDNEAGEDDDSHGPIWEAISKHKRVIPVYIFYGRAPKEELKEYDGDRFDLSAKNLREFEIHAVATKIGKKGTPAIIRKPRLSPLAYRPLYLAKWESLPNESGGVGVPENIEDTQMIVNGLTRSMLDNKALAANLMMWWNPARMAPGMNKALYPGKAFETSEGVDDVAKAMQFFAPPDITGNTPKLIEFFKQFADEESGLARQMEGQTLESRITAYEVSKMVESGNKMIGGVMRSHDLGHMKPLVEAFYHWHMLTNPDETMKGDYTAEAKGFESYVEKAQRGQDIIEVLSLALSSEYTAQFTKVLAFMREICNSKDLNPDDFFPTDVQLQERSDELAALLPEMRMIAQGGQAAVDAAGAGRRSLPSGTGET